MGIVECLDDIEFNVGANHVLNTSGGLFIKENSLEYIAAKLTRHLRNKLVCRIILKKEVKDEILKNDKFYLCEDEMCLVGYVFEGLHLQNIPSSHGNLVSCQEKIVKDDPMFKNSQQIRIIDDPRYYALFNIKGTVYYVESIP